jgi:hypothetical protein
MSNEYLVAKYVASATRMEPRNVGVFVRTGDSWRARFLGESAEGKMDLRKARPVVEHLGSYQQWVEYWRHILRSTSTGEVRHTLESSSKVNFVVAEGPGLFLGPDAPSNPDSTLEYLYHLVVTEFPEQRAEELSLSQIVDDVIRRFKLRESGYFVDSPRIRCELPGGLVEHVRPSYGFLNGQQTFFQKVSINPNRPETAQKEVHNAAWIFEMLHAEKRPRELHSLVKIVRTNLPEDETAFSIEESLGVLNAVSNVVNVEDETAVDRVFAPLSA